MRKRHQENNAGQMGGRGRRASWLLMAVGAATVMLGAIAAVPAATSGAAPSHGENEFHQTNLVSDLSTVGAQLVDPNLKNPWGLASSPTSPLWVSDNNAGVATVYSGDVGGTPVNLRLTVTLPGGRAATGDGPSPTGQVFNPTTGFVVTSKTGSGPAAFIFSSESGQITAWSPAADPILGTAANATSAAQVEFSSPTAVYKGLAIATTLDGSFLYASNFHDGTVDVFDSTFTKVTSSGGFTDPELPPGYAPFGIQNLHGLIYVTYALQNAAKHDDVSGKGHGFIDVYTTDGFLVQRLASRDALNSPWGLTLAPPGFGRFAGELLAGNFGDGRINVFDSLSGDFLGHLRNDHNEPIIIDGLWGLRVGNTATGGPGTVLFSAGINGEADGLVGALNPAK